MSTPPSSPAPGPADPAGAPADDELTLEVERLVAGGEGLARPAGQPVVFVRGALPGERVRARVVDRHRGWERAELTAVVDPSSDRVSPPCPAVAAGCGGCDLQHVDPRAQAALKATTVVDGLRRLGGIDDPEVTVGLALSASGFRTTVRAAVLDGRAGFRRLHSHDVICPDHCLVAHPLVDRILTAGDFGEAREATIRVGAATGEQLVVVSPSAQGVTVPDDGPGPLAVVGQDELAAGHRAWIHEEVAGRRWRISAHSFFQTRPDGAAALVEAVRAAVGTDLAGARLVDAYCGVGLLAGALVSTGVTPGGGRPESVVGVERSASAVADARVNLADDPVRVVRSDLARWRPSPADVVVADPARSGLGRRVVEVLARTGAEVMVLVSCDAASLGRDAALLAGAGYRFERAELVDLFPHSHHVEVVSRFRR